MSDKKNHRAIYNPMNVIDKQIIGQLNFLRNKFWLKESSANLTLREISFGQMISVLKNHRKKNKSIKLMSAKRIIGQFTTK